MADEISIQQLMNRMPKAYLPDVAGDLDAVIQFQFTGAEPGDWIADDAQEQKDLEEILQRHVLDVIPPINE